MAALSPAISEERKRLEGWSSMKEREGGKGEGTTVFGSTDMGVRCHPQRNKKEGERLTGLIQGRNGIEFCL